MAMYAFPPSTAWTFQPSPIVVTLPTTTLKLPSAPAPPTLKPVNDIPLTRVLLKKVLSDLSERLYRSFRRQVRLVVHGGAVMVLHPSFTHRDSTQDVDYIHRSFVKEYRALGFPDAEQRLRGCIAETAYRFNLGADWMNDHADIVLPLALDQQGHRYDPVFYDSTQQQSAASLTIFNERGLALVAVSWPWAVALKLVRYEKKDPEDSAAVLRLGFLERGYRWTVDGLERWLSERCWPMQYSSYSPQKKAQLRERLQDALARALPSSEPAQPPMYQARGQTRTRNQFQLRSPSSVSSMSQASNLLSPLSSSMFTPLQQLPRTNNSVPLYFM